MFTPPSRTVLV